MKNVKILTILVLAIVIVSWAKVSEAAPLGNAFTYQGHLYDANHVANNLYDFQFTIYDANSGGTKKGNDVNIPDVEVIDGYFTVELDFGSSVFDGNAVWLQIGVRQGNLSDPNVYTALSPRRLVTPTPYAIKAKTFNVPADVSGSTSATNAVIKATNTGNGYGLYGYSLSNYGVYGYSSAVPGIYGYSGNAEGVYGVNGAWGNYGYLGGNNYGVYGYAYTGTGGYFASSSGYGLIVGSGNVGIGTTAPSEELHVKGTGFLQGVFESTNSSGGIKLVANNGQAYELQSLNDGGLVIYDRTDLRYCMKIDTSGNIGIGTTTPEEKLTVAGTVSGASTENWGNGIYGVATAPYGVGVYGYATNNLSTAINYGGSFKAEGYSGKGVMGHATGQSSTGGYFISTGTDGNGVVGICAQGSYGTGVYAWGGQYDFYAAGSGIDYGSSSSIRWKRDIQPIDEALDKVMSLRGVYFNWDPNHGGQHDIGMIAEEVGKVLPEIVVYEENGIDASGMDYSKTTPLLVEAIKALKTELDDVRKENIELQKRLAAIEVAIGKSNEGDKQ